MINMTIDLGNIITLVSMLIVLVTFGASLRSSVASLTIRVGVIETKIDRQTDNYTAALIERVQVEHKIELLEQKLEHAIREMREGRSTKDKTPFAEKR